MIEDIRVGAYIESLNTGNSGFLAELEKRAVNDGIPIIKPQAQNLLRTIIAGLKPRSILEVGTAVGFSAILMAECAPEDCRITTIENYEKRISAAKENFKESGYSDRITLIENYDKRIPAAKENFGKSGYADKIRLIEGDAADVLKMLSESRDDSRLYDLIFMDAAKGQYLNFFEDVMALLRTGGILVSDNVLQDGLVHQGQHLLGDAFGVRQQPRAESGRGDNGFSDFHGCTSFVFFVGCSENSQPQ